MAEPISPPKSGARICVQKFNDLNGNGKQDPGEPLLTGWVFTVTDGHGHDVGQVKAGECIDVAPGTYLVGEQAQPGWTATTPNPQKVTVAAQQKIEVVFGNKSQAEQKCCQFGLMLFNTLLNTIKQVVVIPTNPPAVIGLYSGEEPDWTITQSGNQYVIEPVVSPTNPAGFFPADSTAVLDLDFAIKINPALQTDATVRWLDASGQVLKEELLQLPCQEKEVGEEDVDYDWFSWRKTVAGVGDKVLFSGAEPEECEDFEPEEMASVCSTDPYQVTCVSGQSTLIIHPSNYDGTLSYNWTVDDNGTTSSPIGSPLAYPLTPGPHAIDITLTVYDGAGQQQGPSCDISTITVCIPSGDFSVGTPTLQCAPGIHQGQYAVVFTPLDSQDCLNNIASYVWNFGDNTTQPLGTGAPGPITYYYAVQPNNPVTLTVTEKAPLPFVGCSHTVLHPVPAFDTKCNPTYDIEYELCPTKNKIPVTATFKNNSQIFCGPTLQFVWNFGDGPAVPPVNTTVSQTHIYTYDGLKPPAQYNTSLTMTDSPCLGTTQSPSVTFPVSFFLKPVPLNLEVLVCPDGETHFVAQTSGTLVWHLSGGGFLLTSLAWLKCKIKVAVVNAWNSLWKQHNGFVCKLPDGSYTVKAKAEDDEQPHVIATCTKDLDFKVNRTCCDDFKVKNYCGPKTMNGKDYRLYFKHKVVNPTFWFGTRVVGETKFKVKKSVKHTSITYYKKIKAASISVDINDNLRNAGPHPLDPSVTCKSCVKPDLVQGSNSRSNSSKAKYKTSMASHGAEKVDDLASTHYVQHYDGWSWTVKVEKPPGNDCNNPIITC